MTNLFRSDTWIVKQNLNLTEVVLGFESANQYKILSEDGESLGFIAEKSSGLFSWLKRQILRSHRSFEAAVLDADGNTAVILKHPFYWIWSSLFIYDSNDKLLGSVHRRFTLISRRYDLYDVTATSFASVYAGVFRVWTFDFFDRAQNKIGFISKKWGGLVKEYFTDADCYVVKLEPQNQDFSTQQKAIFLAAAVAIDFDYFEENQPRKES